MHSVSRTDSRILTVKISAALELCALEQGTSTIMAYFLMTQWAKALVNKSHDPSVIPGCVSFSWQKGKSLKVVL